MAEDPHQPNWKLSQNRCFPEQFQEKAAHHPDTSVPINTKVSYNHKAADL